MKVPDLTTGHLEQLIGGLKKLAEEKGYTKIFCKVRGGESDIFKKNGFICEAEIPGFFYGMEAGCFLSFYLDPRRAEENDREKNEEVLRISMSKKNDASRSTRPPVMQEGASIRRCVESDTAEMADIYKVVFKTYPFPIHEPEYLLQMMNSHVDFYCISIGGRIVALSSSEKDADHSHSEMTDFATLPDFRGSGFASLLLMEMEKDLLKQNIKTAFTIARAISPGMNITFAKNGYSYAGRLVNNTNISGNMESMNIWYKKVNSAIRV